MTEKRVAVVTGATRGIGRAIALALASKNFIVIPMARDEEALRDLLEELPGSSMYLAVDATSRDAMVGAAERLRSEHGCLDVLVNNIGGVRQFGKFEEISDEDWQEVFETNLMSVVRATRVFLPLIRESSGDRSIVNIASVAGKQPGHFNPHYGAMKAAVIHLTKYLANHLGSEKIRVNSVAMSTVRGGVWDRDVLSKSRMEGVTPAEAETALVSEVRAKSVLGEICLPEDIAELVSFIVSSEARFITGQCLVVDGGTLRSIY